MEKVVLMRLKKAFVVVMISVLAFSSINCANLFYGKTSNIVYADDLVFHYIAPRNQTRYKTIATYSGKVKDLKRMKNKIVAVASSGGMFGTIIGALPFPPTMVIGKVLAAGSASVYLIAKYKSKKLYKLKNNTKWHEKIEFKWIKSDRVPYVAQIRMKSWYTYKNKQIGKVTVRYRTRRFSYGERWY